MIENRQQHSTGTRRRTAGALALAAVAAVAPLAVTSPAHADVETTIVNTTSGKCLDSNSDGKVYMLACNGGRYQRWQIASATESGFKQIINTATGRCLDATDEWYHGVYTLPCNGGTYQMWRPADTMWFHHSTGHVGENHLAALDNGDVQTNFYGNDGDRFWTWTR